MILSPFLTSSTSLISSSMVSQGKMPCLFLSILCWSSTSQATVQETCSKKMKAMQTAAVMQKLLNPGMICVVMKIIDKTLMMCGSHRAGPDAECEDVSDAGHGDADPRVLHGQPHPLRQGQPRLAGVLDQVIPARHDYKHVVNSNSFNQSKYE